MVDVRSALDLPFRVMHSPLREPISKIGTFRWPSDFAPTTTPGFAIDSQLYHRQSVPLDWWVLSRSGNPTEVNTPRVGTISRCAQLPPRPLCQSTPQVREIMRRDRAGMPMRKLVDGCGNKFHGNPESRCPTVVDEETKVCMSRQALDPVQSNIRTCIRAPVFLLRQKIGWATCIFDQVQEIQVMPAD